MKCQRCSRPATLHITEIEDARPLEIHLCDECAREYLTHQVPTSASGLAEHLTKLESAEAQPEMECPGCGTTWSQFRRSGRLGCPSDYAAFAHGLMPLLESIHGATVHAGKTPRRVEPDGRRQAELRRLRQELKHAIAQEAYEEAARIRDRLRRLQGAAGDDADGECD